MNELMGAQVRMARAFLRWSIAQLAKKAGVGISTVQAIEAADGPAEIAPGIDQTREHRAAARAASVEAIRKALVGAGLTFLPDDGKAGIGVRGKRRK
jgi:transcriptional regulator with XRE-family HTH domain